MILKLSITLIRVPPFTIWQWHSFIPQLSVIASQASSPTPYIIVISRVYTPLPRIILQLRNTPLFQTTAMIIKERGRTKLLVNNLYFILGSGDKGEPQETVKPSQQFILNRSLSSLRMDSSSISSLHRVTRLLIIIYSLFKGSNSLIWLCGHTCSIETYMCLNTYTHTYKKKIKGITGGLLCKLEI